MTDAERTELDGLPVVREAFARTVRLISTAARRAAVLSALVAVDDLADLAEIEGATSGRLLAQERGMPGMPVSELVFGAPHSAFINAAFAYARPGVLNRFNGPDRGAWYAALAVETALAEVAYHMGRFLGDAGDYRAVVDYSELHASLAGEFVDLRDARTHPCLSEPPAGYQAGVALAALVRSAGLNGLIYPSVRHAGGTCFAALWPHAVQSVAQGGVWRLQWKEAAAPEVSRL